MTPDTSVVIARAAGWHGRHADARRAVEDVDDLVAHLALEAYSVLTRLPPEQRVAPSVVGEHLRVEYAGERLILPADATRGLVDRLAELRVVGGSVYDALVAATAAAHGRTLLTFDRRAADTYARMGARVEFL
ncbi:MAG: PIN domain-containing protein [Actinomycetota bacterium]|nr:PIN domain-containing protein [Actinomycetota bacterium]